MTETQTEHETSTANPEVAALGERGVVKVLEDLRRANQGHYAISSAYEEFVVGAVACQGLLDEHERPATAPACCIAPTQHSGNRRHPHQVDRPRPAEPGYADPGEQRV